MCATVPGADALASRLMGCSLTSWGARLRVMGRASLQHSQVDGWSPRQDVYFDAAILTHPMDPDPGGPCRRTGPRAHRPPRTATHARGRAMAGARNHKKAFTLTHCNSTDKGGGGKNLTCVLTRGRGRIFDIVC